MNVRKIAVVGTLAAALVGSGGASAFAATAPSSVAPASTSPTVSATCLPDGHDDAWPVWVDGRPPRDPGVTIWHNAQGWHLRVTHNALHDRVFSGEIRTTGALVAVQAVRLERNDSLQVGAGKHTLKFRFNNYGGTDGFDFATKCAPFLQFGFLSDGHVLAVSHISIGAASRHPARDPFVIARTA